MKKLQFRKKIAILLFHLESNKKKLSHIFQMTECVGGMVMCIKSDNWQHYFSFGVKQRKLAHYLQSVIEHK